MAAPVPEAAIRGTKVVRRKRRPSSFIWEEYFLLSTGIEKRNVQQDNVHISRYGIGNVRLAAVRAATAWRGTRSRPLNARANSTGSGLESHQYYCCVTKYAWIIETPKISPKGNSTL